MEEKRFKVKFIDGGFREFCFQLTQSQVKLLKYLIENDVDTYDAEMSIVNDTIDYEII